MANEVTAFNCWVEKWGMATPPSLPFRAAAAAAEWVGSCGKRVSEAYIESHSKGRERERRGGLKDGYQVARLPQAS